MTTKPEKKTKTTPTLHKPIRVNVDFPSAFLREIDTEADRVGIPRGAFIKFVLAQALRQMRPVFVDSVAGSGVSHVR